MVTVNTCCREAPAGNTNLLINTGETVIEFEHGRSISAAMTIYGSVVFGGGPCSADDPAPAGFVNLALFGHGEVTGAARAEAKVGGRIVQSGSIIEVVISGGSGLGTAVLRPVEASNIVYLIDADCPHRSKARSPPGA